MATVGVDSVVIIIVLDVKPEKPVTPYSIIYLPYNTQLFSYSYYEYIMKDPYNSER